MTHPSAKQPRHEIVEAPILPSVLAFLLPVLFLIYLTPAAHYFLIDPDGGTFLQGALQILRVGEHPQLNFLSSYGPLSYEIRALLIAALGDRTATEVIYAALGYAAAYYLMYRFALRMSGSQICAFAVLIIALLCIPRYYKNFTVLVPAATIIVTAWHVRSASRPSAFCVGLSVAVATLFRHDYGAYSFLAAMLAACLMLKENRISIRDQVFWFALGAAMLAVPWGVLLTAYGTLGEYLMTVTAGSASIAEGLSLPHPLLHWSGAASAIYLGWYMLPVLSAMSLATSRGALPGAEFKVGVVTTFLAALCLLQSAHRADIGHLLQGGAPSLLLLAVLWRCAVAHRPARPLAALGALVSVAFTLLLLANFQHFQRHTVAGIVQNLQDAWLPKAALLERITASGAAPSHAALANYIASCLRADERVQVFPYFPMITYFSDRVAGGGTHGVGPGYFSSEAFQRSIVASFERDRTPLILWLESFAYDGLPERNPVDTHRLVHDYVNENFRTAGQFEGFTVYLRRDDPRNCG